MSKPEKDVDPIIAGYCQAVLQKDPEAFLSLYSQEVRVFDTWMNWSHEGKDAFRSPITDWFTTLPKDEQVIVKFDEVKCFEIGTDLCATAFVTYTAVDSENKPLRSMTNRLSWALARDVDGALTIVHEHTSTPVDFNGMKAILHRI